MRRIKILLTAGVDTPINIAGDYLRVIAGSAEFEIQPDTGQTLAGMQSGMAWTAKKQFEKLLLKSAVTQTVELMAGLDRIDDNRSSISGTVDTSSKGATLSNAAHTVGLTAAALLTTDVTRRSVIINNEDASNAIYIGNDATVTAGTGLKVSAGQSLSLTHSAGAAIYAIGAAAGMTVKTLSEID